MRNIRNIFHADLRRLTASAVAVVIIMGLCLIPCLYAWFNILSNWDPYGPDSTGNIRVAVSNEDKGADVLGLHLNIGDLVLEKLKGNDQLGWVFVDDTDDALKSVYSGDCYAALVVSEDFTGDLLSVLNGNLEHPQIIYYENEKKNAIAPKITNKAKNAIQDQINATLVETVGDVFHGMQSALHALGIDGNDAAKRITQRLDDTVSDLGQLKATLLSVQDVLESTDNALDMSSATLGDLENVLQHSKDVVQDVDNGLTDIGDDIENADSATVAELGEIDQRLADFDIQLQNWDGGDAMRKQLLTSLHTLQQRVDTAKERYADVAAVLESVDTELAQIQEKLEKWSPSDTVAKLTDHLDKAHDAVHQALSSADSRTTNADSAAVLELGEIDQLLADFNTQLQKWDGSKTMRKQLLTSLHTLQQRVDTAKERHADIAAVLESIDAELAQIQEKLEQWSPSDTVAKLTDHLDNAREAVHQALSAADSRISQSIRDTADEIHSTLSDIENAIGQFSGRTEEMSDALSAFENAMNASDTTIAEAIALIDTVQGDVKQIADDARRIFTSDAFQSFTDVMENSPESIATYLASPVQVNTTVFYEIDSYGAAMAPYYIMLALFVGSLLAATMIRVPVEPLPVSLTNVRPWQKFFGRYLLFFCIGMTQALITSLGCLYYIDIQCAEPVLFILACCVCSLNFTLMNYALVYALDNIGMAAAVIIMVIQVAGSGGSYPIDVLPEIFRKLYPFMPFHYGMDMIRETIGGCYGTTYWHCVAVMLGMCAIFLLLAFLRRPAKSFNQLIARDKEASGIM